uniref:Disease resistance protein n=1 Tax=Rhabditophanes sp. KR3021 TaxID=114890 RepID=A0AC35TTK8_9BILA
MPVQSTVPVWIYVIFRKNPSSGHENMAINVSSDGPVFWNREVAYVFCCSCHFDKHEIELLKLFDRYQSRIERICLVDRPLDYPFLPDSLFTYMATTLTNLEFIYLRELNLEKINRGTVEKLSKHKNLKKMIVHGCRKYEVLQDFKGLPQLLVVKGEIQGLKAMLGDIFDFDTSSPISSSSSPATTIDDDKKSEEDSSEENLLEGEMAEEFEGDDVTAQLQSTLSKITVSD